jgi:formylglycine-generating enzyme required for sulfatase activity
MDASTGFKNGHEAQNLQDWLDGQRSRPEWPVLRGMIASLLDALERFHADTGAHGAISPRTVHVVGVMPPQIELVRPEPLVSAPNPDPDAPAYLAPEMRDGRSPPTQASDVFGLAAVAYRMVTGRAPEVVCGDQQPAKHLMAGHLAADDYPPDFLAAIDATLVTAPGERLTISAWRACALPASFAQTASSAGLTDQAGAHEVAARQPIPHTAFRRLGHAGGGGVNRLLLGLAAGAVLTTVLGTWLLIRLASVIGPGPAQLSGTGPVGSVVADAQVPAKPVTSPPGTSPSVPASASAPTAAALPAPTIPPGRALRSPFRDCDNCPEMVVIEPGTVRMRLVPPGASEPRDLVATITRPFAVGRFELTRSEFRAFAEATGFAPPPGCYVRTPEWRLDERLSWQAPGYRQDDRHPVACLSFDDAKAYVAWLSGRTGASYRLLTDAEWHLIASSPDVPEERGAGQCRFANGADQTARDAEPGWTTADCSDGFLYTAPVGSFAATGPGLGDLFGNLWEWVDSCEPDFSGATPVFGACSSAAPRILRGGSWSDRPEMLALDARVLSPPHVRDQIAGVRIAREISPCEAKACSSDSSASKAASETASIAFEPAGHVEAIKVRSDRTAH